MGGASPLDPTQCSGTVSFSEWRIHAGWVAPCRSFAARHSHCDEVSGIALAFSGECYRDDCDSALAGDWIIREYQKKGDRCFEELNGLFSGLLIDRQHARAFLFNDRYGIERIYVHESGGAVYFASEAKALLRALPELRGFDEEGLAQYLAFGCTMGERTLFRGVDLLPGGSCWRFGPRRLESRSRYFTPRPVGDAGATEQQQYEAEFGETFQRVLPRYTEDGESVGISLTGGLDTPHGMACLPENPTRRIPAIRLLANRPHARCSSCRPVAAVCGLQHQPLRIGSDFLRDFGTYLDRTVSVTDGCAGATSSHEIYFNAQARQLSPVRLTGNFGSEVVRSRLSNRCDSSRACSATASPKPWPPPRKGILARECIRSHLPLSERSPGIFSVFSRRAALSYFPHPISR